MVNASVPSVPPAVPAKATVTMSASPVYAGFWRRFAAILIDVILLGVVNAVIGMIFGLVGAATSMAVNSGGSQNTIPTIITSGLSSLLNFVISIGYYVYMTGSRGQTFGKMALKIKVRRLDGVEPVGYVQAFLREVVGRFLSGLVLGIGYLWMLWDGRKQTWHDKIAGTIVVKV